MERSSSQTASPLRRFFPTYYQKVKNWMFVTTPSSDPLVRSYLFLRSGIGIISMALPFVLIIGSIILDQKWELSYSLSAYYYGVTSSVFIGSLWAIGIFLICYQYDHLDNFVSTIAGICVIGVALFPTTRDGATATPQQEMIGKVHFLCATGFLVALAFMAFLFTRKNPDQANVTDTDKKRKRFRNKVYVICGIVMVACIAAGAIILLVPYLSDDRWQHHYYPILIIEIVSTFAFGIAWFVKGETLGRLKAVMQRHPLSLR